MTPKPLSRPALVLLATLGLSAPGTGGRAQEAGASKRPAIPKVWVDEELDSLQVPLATPRASPVLVGAEFYDRIPVRTIFRSYSIYSPDREPPGYLDWLKRQEPVDAWAAARRETEEDWIRAGELVFDAPIQLEDVDSPSGKLLQDAAWLNHVGMPIAGDGVLPFQRYVIREKGKIEVGNLSCAHCHTRVMPDGSVIRGAQGNFPNVALGFGHETGFARRLSRLLFDAPWIKPDPLAAIDGMSADEIRELAAAEPLGVMARHGTSLFSPVQVPDLIGVKDRRYLDHTGLVIHRGPADLMRYAALNQDADLLSRYGDFVPLGAFLGRPPEPSDRGIGTGRYGDEQLHALALYLYALEPPPNPNAFDARATRGEAVFKREDCGRCHTPPLFTNNRLMKVVGFEVPEGHRERFRIASEPIDTDPDLALKTRRGTGYYKVPSLRGVWYRSMFGHGGWCATLEDWFDPHRFEADYVPTGFRGYKVKTRAVPGHEFGLDLDDEDKRALIAYLKTL